MTIASRNFSYPIWDFTACFHFSLSSYVPSKSLYVEFCKCSNITADTCSRKANSRILSSSLMPLQDVCVRKDSQFFMKIPS